MTPWVRAMLIATATAACALRITGWDRGESDFVHPEAARRGETSAFYHFHPDETTLIHASLALDDPRQPPLTAYGMLPMYLARVVLECVGWFQQGDLDTDSVRGSRLAVQGVRVLSILLSMATLAVMWALTRSLWGERTALVALLLVGAVPLAIQQAHFYTADGLFALLALLSLGVAIRVRDSGPWTFVLAGLLIGATAATRLNGLLTAAVLAVAYFSSASGCRGVLQKLRRQEIWYAALATVVTVVALQPHLLLDPGSMLRATGTDDFAYSMAIATGQILRPWSLADTHTTSFLHFWTALWPQGVGWPLTLLLALAWVRAVFRGGIQDRLLALWCALFFLTVGDLHTKHVRYLLPMLAPLGMLAARMIVEAWDCCARRRWLLVVIIPCVFYTWIYGVAFGRIYRLEDARVTAGRWIHDHVPEGASIAIERGGFSMRGSFDAVTYGELYLNTTTVFATRGYLSCGAAASYLMERLERADWVAVTDVNRYRQFSAAPELYPVLSSFYTKLIAGDLGFAAAQRFKVYPQVAGWTFDDDQAEPSFLGFDHPAVHVLRRESQYRASFDAWRNSAAQLPGCADVDLRAAVQAMEKGKLEEAESRLTQARDSEPGLVHLLQARIHERRGVAELARLSLESFSDGVHDRSLAASLLPWGAAASLIDLGLVVEAVRILELWWERRTGLTEVDREVMAKSYLSVGTQLLAVRQDLAERAYLMAADIWESPLTLNLAARLVQERGAAAPALALWQRSLSLADTQVDAHMAAGRAAGDLGDREQALHHLQRAVVLTLAGSPAGPLDAVTRTARRLHELGATERVTEYLHALATRHSEWSVGLRALAETLGSAARRP